MRDLLEFLNFAVVLIALIALMHKVTLFLYSNFGLSNKMPFSAQQAQMEWLYSVLFKKKLLFYCLAVMLVLNLIYWPFFND
jgi:hypothetical protein